MTTHRRRIAQSLGWLLVTLSCASNANVSGSNSLFEIDPKTGNRRAVAVQYAPYDLYWTPDGTRAIVMAERLDRIDFYDRTTWTKVASTKAPCKSQMKGTSYGGVNHADWSADGSYFLRPASLPAT